MTKNKEQTKSNNPADSSAQHLANLLGVPVVNAIPDKPLKDTDIDEELIIRNNYYVAEIYLISALYKGNNEQKALIKQQLTPVLNDKYISFASFLFNTLYSLDASEKEFNIKKQKDVTGVIRQYQSAMKYRKFSKVEIQTYKYTLSQINEFTISSKRILMAIEIFHKKHM